MKRKAATRGMKALIGLGLLCLLGLARAQSSNDKCSQLEGAAGKQIVEYLQRDRAGLEPSCILYAIDRLGRQAYAPAAETLVRYLDVPPWPSNGSGIPREVTAKTMFYPAVVALSDIGKPAAPALLDAIGGPGLSEVGRKNAVQTLQFIYKGDSPAEIADLVRASRAARDPMVAGRLSDVARETAAKCDVRSWGACQQALR
jgi:hypothetical protein